MIIILYYYNILKGKDLLKFYKQFISLVKSIPKFLKYIILFVQIKNTALMKGFIFF